ncbi:arginase [Pedobacter sp. GR22-10]|uniref:arginase n=1 Tax=Pedobacter sp. GR22-10 TaxID=2994472 RepID=UPI002247A10A|nr:arginase [Pedobacter sp. GR22-10]MCX2430169.1 arginase [Pedobacter sp. GR22-10]
MGKVIKLIKNRSDIGAGTRGSDLGIDAIEIAAINKGSEYFSQYAFLDVKTHNESIYNKDRNAFAKRIAQVLEQCERVAQAVSVTLMDNEFPIVLSGDHSSALGTISGIRMAKPEEDLGVVWIDAHADIHSPFTSPSGNIHGMPLAAALGIDNKENQVNNLEDETIELWNRMKEIGMKEKKIAPDNLVYFGVRDMEQAELALIKQKSIRNFSVEEVRYLGIEQCVQEALNRLSHCKIIYISFDVDSMDSDRISDGTGTPVPKGFDISEILEIMDRILASNKVICLEVVEVNPLLDRKGNKMAEAAFEILERATNQILEI